MEWDGKHGNQIKGKKKIARICIQYIEYFCKWFFLGVKVSQWYFACLADAVSADWKNHHKQS